VTFTPEITRRAVASYPHAPDARFMDTFARSCMFGLVACANKVIVSIFRVGLSRTPLEIIPTDVKPCELPVKVKDCDGADC
jgi:hypothetical protein